MFKNLSKIIAFMAVVAVLASVGVGVASAADEPTAGFGPDTALAATGDWEGIAPGESRWYVFHYDYDNSSDDNRPSQAVVELEMGHEDSVSFEVWTQNQLRLWADGVDFDALGVGSKKSNFTGNDDHDTKLLWAVKERSSETFYVIVDNERDIASYYVLNINGQDVTFPTAGMNVVEKVSPAADDEILTETMALTVEDTPASAIVDGYSADTAIATSHDSVTLQPGQQIWYTFEYDFDNNDENNTPSQALVEVAVDVQDSISFEVWTPDQVRLWAENVEFDATGEGTIFRDGTGDNDPNRNLLVWSGSAPASNTYYVIVENETDSPANYTISISGEDVSF